MPQCKTHKNYAGLRKPKSSKNNPDGCPECWEIYRTVVAKFHEEPAKPKRRKAIPKPKIEKASGSGLSYVLDSVSGEYEILKGKSCLYIASDLDFVDAFITGYIEGAKNG